MSPDPSEVIARLGHVRLLPVLTVKAIEQAEPLARALLAGGITVAEVTFRTDVAADAIRVMRDVCPETMVGAGTILSAAQVKEAREAGSQFIVTPGFNPIVVEEALAVGPTILPGVNNPTSVEQALGYGIKTMKFFPAEPSGGVPFIKALAEPYNGISFVPTGGIGLHNLSSYLALPNVLACGGSWMADPSLIATGKFDEISRVSAESVRAARFAEGL